MPYHQMNYNCLIAVFVCQSPDNEWIDYVFMAQKAGLDVINAYWFEIRTGMAKMLF